MIASRALGDGLVLRWATAADAEALAAFNFEMHNDNPGGTPELWLKAWTRDLMSGRHPTTNAGDITVVVDEHDGHRIVSSAALIGQTWRYAGRHFGCGRPELIGTDDRYRRRGLVRAQMELLHTRSAERGDLVQAITGIPWFYRQFGYEMAVSLSGGRRLELAKIPKLRDGKQETFTMRKATVGDIGRLRDLYEVFCSQGLISCYRDETIWNHELSRAGLDKLRNLHVVESLAGKVVGYCDLAGVGRIDTIRELAVDPTVSLRAVCEFIARWLKTRLESDESTRTPAEGDLQPVSGLYFQLGERHPVYEAMAPELGQTVPAYAWYVRVPDLLAFLTHIRPVLEDRMAQSEMAGHSGALRLNFYQSQLTLRFDSGLLVEVGAYRPKHFFDGDAYFPDLSFLQLLFGYRSLEEIHHIRPDCFAERSSPEAVVLLKSLFPKQPSQVSPIA